MILPAHPATAGEYTDPAFSQQLYYLQSMPLYVLDEKKVPTLMWAILFLVFSGCWYQFSLRLADVGAWASGILSPCFSLKADLTVLQPDRLVPRADVQLFTFWH